MIYKGIELKQYPICDTDIWVDVVLAELDEILISKYSKLVVADVVEKEILKFNHDGSFRNIAEKYLLYKKDGKIIVIEHSDIDEIDRRFLERQLVDCDARFVTGLKDDPHEQHKGEIVSAIYAEYFESPFLKSNDSTFRPGNMGRVAFPNLIVKNRRDMLIDLVSDRILRRSYNDKIEDSRAFMNEEKRLYEEQMNQPATEEDVMALLTVLRSK